MAACMAAVSSVIPNAASISAIEQALQWVVDHQAEDHIVAVNLSLGAGDVVKGQTIPALESLYRQLAACEEEIGAGLLDVFQRDYAARLHATNRHSVKVGEFPAQCERSINRLGLTPQTR